MQEQLIGYGVELIVNHPVEAIIGTTSILMSMRLTNFARQMAKRDAVEEGLGGERPGADVHHIIPVEVAEAQGIDSELITSRFNALALPRWIHKKLHQRFTNEELASLGYEGTLEEAKKIRDEKR